MENEELNEKEINERAKKLAQKLYEDNKELIDETLDENKEVYDTNKENAYIKPKKKKHFFLKLFGLAAILLILILVCSNVIASGKEIIEKTDNVYLGYGFYGLVCLLLIILVIIPSFEIFCLPSYKSLFSVEEKGNKGKIIANMKKIMLITKKHQDEWLGKAKKEEKDKFNDALEKLRHSSNDEEIKKSYKYISKKYIKKDILKIVSNYSNKIFISTSVSQSGKIDSLLIFFTYFKMAKDILRYCGFRISFVRLCKLSINMLSTIIASTKLNDIDYSAILKDSILDTLSMIPGAKVIVNSLADGFANSLLFYRTGVILEELLISDNQNPVYIFAISLKETASYILVGMLGTILTKIMQFTKYTVKSAITATSTFFQSLFNKVKPKAKEAKE